MTETPATAPLRSSRAEQARREIGETRVSTPVAVLLVAVFAVAVSVPPATQTALDLIAGHGPLPALGPLAEGLGAVGDTPGIFAANRSLLAAIEATEERLEEESWLRARLLPPTQRVLTTGLGLGNEQAVAGRGGWWHLAADVRHVTGRGFLDPRAQRRRELDEGVSADPLPALAALAADLARRDVELLVVPVPAKPSVNPGSLWGRAAPPVHNPSHALFVERLEDAGIAVYDPTADLVALESSGGRAFLRTDTHWTPAGLDRVAAAIAERLRLLGVAVDPGRYSRRRAVVDGRGDLTAMLRLPAAAVETESVEVDVVLTAAGDLWRTAASAEVLLLGDSFANVFSDSTLGWGAGAGLAEQISFHLGAPLDRLARNAGGAERARAELAAQLAAGGDRLGGKRVVVYQFAARELSLGDWRPIELPVP